MIYETQEDYTTTESRGQEKLKVYSTSEVAHQIAQLIFTDLQSEFHPQGGGGSIPPKQLSFPPKHYVSP